MNNLFGMEAIALGYAESRPAVHPRVIERIRRRLGSQKVRRALDVGCGAGLSTRPLEQLAEHCFGIEPAESMLRRSSTVAPRAMFVAGVAESLPFRDASIDMITAAGSLNYADLARFFPEAARVLAPAGTLIVYDFSSGRSFRDSGALDAWYTEFESRYPPARDGAQDLTPESLAALPYGFKLNGREDFEIGLSLTPDFYLDYVMTETNVAWAVKNGVSPGAIRSWCADSVQGVFSGVAREVLFRGYIAYMEVSGIPPA
jgi:SAM-dependent methyltransferase